MPERIPVFRPSSEPATEAFLEAMRGPLEKKWYILGTETENFEKSFAAYCGAKYACGVGNGTDALEIALRALGVGPGHRVLLVANAGFYGSTAVYACGATPYYVDVDPQSLTLSATSLLQALSQPTQALIVTHLYGRMADMPALLALAAEFKIPVIEDCAQAHGAKLNGQKVGSFGALSCFSFYPTKNLGALGDGGAVLCSDAELATKVRQLRQYGWSSKYKVDLAGGCNSRLDEIQAAVLNLKLKFLDEENEKRRQISARYAAGLQGLPLILPPVMGTADVAHLYVIRSRQRDALRKELDLQGVSTDVHYPIPDHLQSAYRSSQGLGSLPVTEAASLEILSLPCFPDLTSQEQDRVIEAVKKGCAACSH